MTSTALASAEALWRSIDATPELSGVLADWEQIAGADLPAIRPFLKPYRELASSYPCPFLAGDGCPRDVIVRSGEIRAVCRSKMQSCETLRLTKPDVVAYELDLVGLGGHLARVLGLHGATVEEEGISKTVRMGSCCPVAGVSRPVFIMASFLESRIERLMAHVGSMFLLLVPVIDDQTSSFNNLLRARDVTVVELAQATAISETSELVATDAGSEAIRRFATDGLPTSSGDDGDGVAFFPTPTGSSWTDVKLRLVDGNTVSVQVRDASGVFNFAQLGMANRVNAAPTVQWKLLCDFAYDRGVMTWESRSASRKNKKRREYLARDLRRFLRIEGDPIELTPDGKGWKTRFAIEPPR